MKTKENNKTLLIAIKEKENRVLLKSFKNVKVFAKQRINKEIKNIEWLLVNLCLSNTARIQLQW